MFQQIGKFFKKSIYSQLEKEVEYFIRRVILKKIFKMLQNILAVILILFGILITIIGLLFTIGAILNIPFYFTTIGIGLLITIFGGILYLVSQ